MGAVPTGRALSASAFLLFLLVALLPTSSSGLNQTLNIVAVAPDTEYGIGEIATVTVHIVNAGAHVDASAIDVILNHLRPMQRFVPAERVAVGIYQSAFEILPEDVVALAVRVSVRASVGDLQDYRILYLLIDYKEIEVTASTPRASPGEVVELTVQVRQSGLLRDAPTLVLVARVPTTGMGSDTAVGVQVQHAELGTYRGRYEVPRSITQDTAISFLAWETSEVRISGGAVVFVDVPAKLLVWYHEVAIGPSDATVEILVANATGWPVGDAQVVLDYGYFDASLTFSEFRVSRPTDGRGIATFTLSYTDARSTVGFWGTVAAEVGNQGFSGSLVPSTFVQDRRYEIARDNTLEVFPPREIAPLHYTITEDKIPVANQVVYFVARTGERLIAYGETQSDDAGRFTVDVRVPAGYTTIEFATRIDSFWLYERDTVFSANRLSVELGEVYVGSITQVSMTMPDDATPWLAFVTFLPYRLARGSFENPWVPASGSLSAYDVAVDKGTIEHTLVVPRFLPKGEDYVLLVYAYPHRPVVTDADFHMYIEKVRIENLPPTAIAQPTSLAVTTESPLEVDMGPSFDRDGVVAAYEIDWGDGSMTAWTADPFATHLYRKAGAYEVTVRVQDDGGAIAAVSYSVSVHATTFGMPTSVVVSAVGAATIGAALASLLLWRRRRGPPKLLV